MRLINVQFRNIVIAVIDVNVRCCGQKGEHCEPLQYCAVRAYSLSRARIRKSAVRIFVQHAQMLCLSRRRLSLLSWLVLGFGDVYLGVSEDAADIGGASKEIE